MDETKLVTIGRLAIDPMKQISKVAGILDSAKDFISVLVKASPEASLAWAAVCMALPLLTNPRRSDEANRDGFKHVTIRMHYYTGLQPLCDRLCQRPDTSSVSAPVEDSIMLLYQHILDFLISSSLRFFSSAPKRFQGDVLQSQDWNKKSQDIQDLEKAVDRNLKQISQLTIGHDLKSLDETSQKSAGSLEQLLSLSEQQLRVTEEHTDIAQKQLALQENTLQQRLDEKEEKCHQLFRLTSSNKDATYEWYKDRVQDRVEGTCEWLLNHADFQNWLAQESGLLLVSADPGCGKSVLAKHLINKLSHSGTVCYFFFKDQDQNTTRQALCALLHQLFSTKPHLIKHAMPEFSENGPNLVNTTASLWKIFDNAVRDPQAGAVVVVLDALDECAEPELEDLVKHSTLR